MTSSATRPPGDSASGTQHYFPQQARFSLLRPTRKRPLLLLAMVASVFLVNPFVRSAAVINGTVVDPAPSWAVALATDTSPICSGVLIAPNLVLTAGHCRAASQALIGRSDLQNLSTGATARVAHVIGHSTKDLAVIVLDRSVSLTPIAIGSDDPISDTMSFVPFTFYGYGRTNDLSGSTPNVDGRLRSAVGLIATCNPAYGLSAPEFCVKSQKITSPCQGDSGGPLVASNHLMGIFKAVFVPSGNPRCVGSDWRVISVPNREIKQWVDDVMEVNSSS
jgi:secreted trypsin-like serine protease